MTQSIFRPGKGSRDTLYLTAVAQETMYPYDWVSLSLTDPTTQNAVDGKSLLAHEFVYCRLTDANAAYQTEGLSLGVCCGVGINAVRDSYDVSGDVVSADTIVIIQNWGIHPSARSQGLGGYGACSQGNTPGKPNQGGTNLSYSTWMGFMMQSASAANEYTRISGGAAEYHGATFVYCSF